MTSFPDLFAALSAPFDPTELKTRSAPGGKQLTYITARTAMNRLDNVLGPENWWDTYTPHENSVLCALTVRLPDGSTLTKCDAGGYAGMADSGDDDKSGYSDAFKRAAVKFGVSRYLYRDGTPTFAAPEPEPAPQPAPAPRTNGHSNGKQRGAWGSPPEARGGPHASQPQEAPVNWGHGAKPPTATATAPAPPPKPNDDTRLPISGKGMFRWVKEQEERYEVNLLKYLNGYAKLQEFPARMVDWDAGQVALAYAEALRKLASYQPDRGDAYEDDGADYDRP
jgi:hypothetical protein